MLERLTRATRGAAITYLERRPYENVYLQWLVENGLLAYHDDAVVLWRQGEAVEGAAYFGPQLVVAAHEDRVLDAFAAEARRHLPPRMLVAPKTTADAMWERLRSWHRPPTLVRACQPLYVITPHDLAPTEPIQVRQARPADAEIVIEHSARMILGELEYDPRRARTGFAAGVRGMIERGWWWISMNDDGELRFMCNVGSRTAATAQIQGVWSPPEMRGQGVATRALGAIARRLLDTNASLSLYVNDFNSSAIALYERLGFRRAGEFSTYLFGP